MSLIHTEQEWSDEFEDEDGDEAPPGTTTCT